jgi:hypothetical protein
MDQYIVKELNPNYIYDRVKQIKIHDLNNQTLRSHLQVPN